VEENVVVEHSVCSPMEELQRWRWHPACRLSGERLRVVECRALSSRSVGLFDRGGGTTGQFCAWLLRGNGDGERRLGARERGQFR
jgi:hypothetical protein